MKKITLLLLFTSYIVNAQNVIIEQPPIVNATSDAFISVEGNNGIGLYTTDDFTITENTILGEIDVFGAIPISPFSDLLSFNIIIYEDDAGLPAGNPSQPSTGVVELRNIPSDHYTYNEEDSGDNNFTVRITDANNGTQITLTPGTYWLVVFPTINLPFSLDSESRWFWYKSSAPNTGVEPLFIDPTDVFEAGLTSWTNISSLGNQFPSTAFVIRDEQSLSIEDNFLKDNVSLYPNPTKEKLNINFSKNLGNTNLIIFNTTGQEVLSENVDGLGAKTLNTDDLSTGVYFLQIVTETASNTIKFIKS